MFCNPYMISQHNPATLRASVIGAALVLAPFSSNADTIYWDGSSAGWDNTANWTTDPAATTPDPALAPGAADDAVFNRDGINTNATVSLNANQAANSLTFLSTGTLTLQGGGTNYTLTLGSGGVSKTGTGAVTIGSSTAGQNVAVTLGGSQTWTNGNSTGGLTFNNAITGAASATQTLTIDGVGTTTLSGGLANGSGGTVSLVKDGSGALSLRTASTFTGTTTLNAGAINNGGLTTSISNAAGTGQLIINGGSISNSATTGSGGFSLGNTSQVWGGDFSLSTGGSTTSSLTLGAAAGNTITLTGNRIVSVSGASNNARININGTIGDGGNNYGLTWSGAGNVRVTLNGTASTYTGTTTIEGGLLQFATAVNSGTNSAFGNSTSAILLGATSGSSAAGILATANATFARDITLQSGGTGALVIGGTVFSGGDTGGNMTNTGTITLGTGTTGRSVTLHRGTFSGNIVDPAGLLSSAGTVTVSAFRTINGNAENSTGVTLSGNNTFSGGVILTNDSSGSANSTVTLRINSATALGTGTFTIGSALSDRNVAIDNTSGSAITLTNNNAQVWNGDFAWTGANALDMGTGAVSLGVNAGATRTVTTNGANALSIGGTIADGTNGTTPTTNLTKAGAGTLILYGDSTYTGTTTVSAGTLQIGNGGTTGSLATSAIVNNGAVIFNRSNDGLSLGAGISGTGSVTQSGAGRTTLAGSSSYAGATTINAGTLRVSGSGALTGTSGITVNGGALDYDNDSLALDRNVTIAGGAFRQNSTQNYTGSLTFTSGTVGGTNFNGVSLTGSNAIGAGKTIAPGNSTGTLAVDNVAFQDGGTFQWEISALSTAQGGAGGTLGGTTGWDWIDGVGGTLDLGALSAGGFTVTINSTGSLAGWNANGSYQWMIASFDSITGSISGLALDTSGFSSSNSILPDQFFISSNGSDLFLNYGSAVPEPAETTLLFGGFVACLAFARRKRDGRFL